MTESATPTQLVRVLRDAAPYLLAHRHKKVVICLPKELLTKDLLAPWLGDIAILQEVVGMQFALSFAATENKPGLGAVTAQQLEQLQNEATKLRSILETSFTQATPSGIHGVSTITANPLSARTAGVIDGNDLGSMGVPKSIDKQDANSLLATNKIVILPPIGHSHDGASLYLDAATVALEFAKAGSADKLVFILPPTLAEQLDFKELTLAEITKRLDNNEIPPDLVHVIKTGTQALQAGVERIHYLNMAKPGTLLLEFLLPDGIAAMLSKDPFDAVRQAKASDIAAIAELMEAGINSGALRPRTLTELQEKINDYVVVSRDEALIACASLEITQDLAEFGSLAVRPDYSNQAFGQLLLDYCIQQATQAGITKLVAVTTQAVDWFTQREFASSTTDILPPTRQAQIQERNAQVLVRKL